MSSNSNTVAQAAILLLGYVETDLLKLDRSDSAGNYMQNIPTQNTEGSGLTRPGSIEWPRLCALSPVMCSRLPSSSSAWLRLLISVHGARTTSYSESQSEDPSAARRGFSAPALRTTRPDERTRRTPGAPETIDRLERAVYRPRPAPVTHLHKGPAGINACRHAGTANCMCRGMQAKFEEKTYKN